MCCQILLVVYQKEGQRDYSCCERGHIVAEYPEEVVLQCTELLKRKSFCTNRVIVEKFYVDVILDTGLNRSMERRSLVLKYLISLLSEWATLCQVLTRERYQAGKGMIDYPDVVMEKFQEESVT